LRYFRVGFYNSFSPSLAPAGHSSIYVETSYSPRRAVNKEGLKEAVINDLIKAKVINSIADIAVCDIVDIKYGYSIYDHNFNTAVSKILGFLNRQDIYSIGRYGRWKNMAMEDALLDGKNTAGII